MDDESKKTGPRDVFSYILAIIFLYTSVVVFGTLVFQYIGIYFPDPLSYEHVWQIRASVRWPISVLVIVFPLYVWLTAYLQKDLIRNPEKRALKTRRWLLYFTLFLTTLVIVGDLVTLIYNFLGGGLTLQFLLKIVTVFIIAITVFVYYIWNLRRDTPALRHPGMRLFVSGVLIVVGASVLGGFFVAGSPQSARLRQFDDVRLANLQQIQSEIINYWQAKEKLPESLDALTDALRGFETPKDPETAVAYEYRKTGALAFELCADFKTSNREDIQTRAAIPATPYEVSDIWIHDASRACFARTIDPDRFPPFKKQIR